MIGRLPCSAAVRVLLAAFALLIGATVALTLPAKAQAEISAACNGASDAPADGALLVTCTYEPATGYHPTHDGGPWANVDLLHDSASDLMKLRTPSSDNNPGFDIVHAQICLSDLTVPQNQCPNDYPNNPANEGLGYRLNPQIFPMLEAGLRNLRTAGLKVVLRFTYNYPANPKKNSSNATDLVETANEPSGTTEACETQPIQDAPIDVILDHLRALAPLIQANRDVVLALQAGFIGCWGEWHDSTHDNELISHHDAFLDEFTRLFKGVTTLEVRRPYVVLDYSRHLYGDIQRAHVLSLGFGIHDDFFGMNPTDSNTFLPEKPSEDPSAPQYSTCLLRRTTAALARHYSMTGETNLGYDFDTRTGCGPRAPDPRNFLAFSRDYSLKTLQWNSDVREFAKLPQLLEKIGPHLTLEQAVLTKRDDGLGVTVTIHNTGWAAITEGRTAWAKLADQHGDVVASAQLSRDLGSIEPAKSVSMTAVLPARWQKGRYTLYVEAPDSSPRLARNPDYSLLFENTGVPDPATGLNVLAYLAVDG